MTIDLSLRWQVICGDALTVMRELPDRRAAKTAWQAAARAPERAP